MAGPHAARHGAHHVPRDARDARQPLDPVAEGANPSLPDAQKNLAEVYGLDKPLWQQFTIFIGKAVRGDFGQSFVYKTRTVREILVETLPVSLLLGSMALALAVAGA